MKCMQIPHLHGCQCKLQNSLILCSLCANFSSSWRPFWGAALSSAELAAVSPICGTNKMCSCCNPCLNRLDELASRYCHFPEWIVTITTIFLILCVGGGFVHVLWRSEETPSNMLPVVLAPFAWTWGCTLYCFVSAWLTHAGPIGEAVGYGVHPLPNASVSASHACVIPSSLETVLMRCISTCQSLKLARRRSRESAAHSSASARLTEGQSTLPREQTERLPSLLQKVQALQTGPRSPLFKLQPVGSLRRATLPPDAHTTRAAAAPKW